MCEGAWPSTLAFDLTSKRALEQICRTFGRKISYKIKKLYFLRAKIRYNDMCVGGGGQNSTRLKIFVEALKISGTLGNGSINIKRREKCS